MDKEKVYEFIKNSFLAPLLDCSNITDISYNGKDIYVVDNVLGRYKSDIIVTNDLVKDFIRQIANLCECQFSYQEPFLDTSIYNLRINAVHHSVAKYKGDDILTFSVRIGSYKNHIYDDNHFLPDNLNKFLIKLLENKISLIISGVTGSGKTELQKYLIEHIPPNERIIIVDNISELDSIESSNLDVNYWQMDTKNKNISTRKLIKNALRSNPDWLILAESRGEEMIDILTSAMTGHPIITTLHSFDNDSASNRMVRMIMQNDNSGNYDQILYDVLYHFRIYIYVNKEETKSGIRRYISSVLYKDHLGTCRLLYQVINNIEHYYKIPKELQNFMQLTNICKEFEGFNENYE